MERRKQREGEERETEIETGERETDIIFHDTRDSPALFLECTCDVRCDPAVPQSSCFPNAS